MALAEERAVMGQYREAIRHLFVGVARDPVRWLPYITYRLARTSARLLRGRRPRPGVHSFRQGRSAGIYSR